MSIFAFLFLTKEECARAATIAAEARGLYGLGAGDRLLERADGEKVRRERRILRRAADDVFLHYDRYSMQHYAETGVMGGPA